MYIVRTHLPGGNFGRSFVITLPARWCASFVATKCQFVKLSKTLSKPFMTRSCNHVVTVPDFHLTMCIVERRSPYYMDANPLSCEQRQLGSAFSVYTRLWTCPSRGRTEYKREASLSLSINVLSSCNDRHNWERTSSLQPQPTQCFCQVASLAVITHSLDMSHSTSTQQHQRLSLLSPPTSRRTASVQLTAIR
jgi:hypothetical protein